MNVVTVKITDGKFEMHNARRHYQCTSQRDMVGATRECRGVSGTLNITFNTTAHATRSGLIRTYLFSSSRWRRLSEGSFKSSWIVVVVNEERRRCEGSRRSQTATIASCKSCIIVIYTMHQPMLIITERHASTTTKRVYERAATVKFTSFCGGRILSPEGVRMHSLLNIPFFPFRSYPLSLFLIY